MFGRKKTTKYYISLTADEVRLVRRALIEFRNKVISAGGPTEDLDELLLKFR